MRFSSVQKIRKTNVSMRYPSIAVVVPLSSWEHAAATTSARAAAEICKKRLWSGRGTNNYQDDYTIYDTEQSCPKRNKRRRPIRPRLSPSDSSTPLASHCSSDIQGVLGSAVLTVESNNSLKPAYFFTFVPDTSQILSRPPPWRQSQ